MFLGTSNTTITHIFSLVSTEVVPRQVQQPITNFTGPGDDFMVHSVNSPIDTTNP